MNCKSFYVSYDQNISASIEDWTADRAMRSKGVHPFNVGDKIANARLVMVGYDRDKGRLYWYS